MIRGIAIFMLLAVAALVAGAPVLTWDPSSGAEGYKVYCGPTPIDTEPVPVQVAAASIDLVGAVTSGTEYECWVRATTTELIGGQPIPDSADSNHVVFTVPMPVQTITYPTPPTSILLRWLTP